MGNDFAAGFALREGDFIVCSKYENAIAEGCKGGNGWNEDDKNAKWRFASDFLFTDTQLDCFVPI